MMSEFSRYQIFMLLNQQRGGLKLAGADLTGANLEGLSLSRADFSGADMKSANLTRANLRSANLNGADLTGANLTGAILTKASLIDTDLTDANLTNALMIRADMMGVYLGLANLTGANLSEADVSGAFMHRTNLTRAYLNGTNLEGTIYDSGTIWPAGFDPGLAGLILSSLAPQKQPVIEVCEIKGASKITKQTWNRHPAESICWYEAWCGANKIASSPEYTINTNSSSIFGRPTSSEEIERMSREARRALMNKLIADGWEPVYSDDGGLLGMQREKG